MELDHPESKPQPADEPSFKSSVHRFPLKIRKCGTEFPIALQAPMQETIVYLGNEIYSGVCPFAVANFGAVSSDEKPDS